MGLLASAGMNGRKDPITIIAPKEIQDWLHATRRLTELFLPYPLHFIDSHTFNNSFELDENFRLRFIPYIIVYLVMLMLLKQHHFSANWIMND